MQNTKIQWCDHTLNLWWGCTEVAIGCDNCYAAVLSKRYGHDAWGNDAKRRLVKGWWKTLNSIKDKSQRRQEFVFVGSMMDIFEKGMPLSNNDDVFNYRGEPFKNTYAVRMEFFHWINTGRFDNLIFQLLTKRPSNILNSIPFEWRVFGEMPKNVWFGVSAATQSEADMYIDQLIANTPATARLFVSLEPQLEKIVLKPRHIGSLSWIVTGGESGAGARPYNPAWATSLVEQTKYRRIPIFVKQLGTHWARSSGTYSEDSKGGNMELWPEDHNLIRRPMMPKWQDR